MYVRSFINDCFHAYQGKNSMSCTKGILERFVLEMIPAIRAVFPDVVSDTDTEADAATGAANQTYKQIYLLLTFDANAVLKKWADEEMTTPKWTAMSPAERKEELLQYLLRHIVDPDEADRAMMQAHVDKLDHVLNMEGEMFL